MNERQSKGIRIKALNGEVEGDTNREEDERDNCERFVYELVLITYISTVCAGVN
jgi:hypothetical protein